MNSASVPGQKLSSVVLTLSIDGNDHEREAQDSARCHEPTVHVDGTLSARNEKQFVGVTPALCPHFIHCERKIGAAATPWKRRRRRKKKKKKINDGTNQN